MRKRDQKSASSDKTIRARLRDRDRETERQTDRKAVRETDTATETERPRETNTQRDSVRKRAAGFYRPTKPFRESSSSYQCDEGEVGKSGETDKKTDRGRNRHSSRK